MLGRDRSGNKGIHVALIEKQSEWRFQSSGIFGYSSGLENFKHLG